MPEIGKTFALEDPVTGRLFVGFGDSLDAAVVDWLHLVNQARAAEICIVARLREYVGGALTPERKAEIVAEIVEAFRANGYTPVTGRYTDYHLGRCAVGAVTSPRDRNLQFARRFNVGDGVIFGVIHGFDALPLEECIDADERDGYEVGAAVHAALGATP